MIDKISLVIPSCQSLKHIENERVIRRGNLETLTGYYKNLKLTKTPDGHIFLSGSLSKYLYGQNVFPLERKGIKTTLDTIAHDTGLELEGARLVQFEIGYTLTVSQPVSRYLDLLGYVSRYSKMPME